MSLRYLQLSITLLLLLTLRLMAHVFSQTALPVGPLPDDFESLHATARKIPFSQAGIAELELIPGISDTLAERIVDKKREIQRRAKTLPAEKRYQCFEVIKGIGDKTAAKIALGIDPLE